MSSVEPKWRRSRRRLAMQLGSLVIRSAWLLLLVGATCTDAFFLRAKAHDENRTLQVKAEDLTPYTVPLTLSLHYVNDTTATALESGAPEDDIVYHFCSSVNQQAGGSQVRKAAEEVGVSIETNFVVVDSLVDTQCNILITNRIADSSGAPDGFFSMEINLEQIVFASSNSTGVLLLDDLSTLVENGFNRGRGGRVRFRQLLQESDSFSGVGDLDVLGGLSTPPPLPSSMPSAAPSGIPSLSPVAPTSSPSASAMPTVIPGTPGPSQIPTADPIENSSMAPSMTSSMAPSATPFTSSPTFFPSKTPSLSPPTIVDILPSDTPSMAPTEVKVASLPKDGLNGVAIAAIVCGGLAALIMCFLICFVYQQRQKKDQQEQAPHGKVPHTPSRKTGSRPSSSLETTPLRSNVQGHSSLLSPVPDILHLDDDHESLAETTLGEQTAGRKHPSTKRGMDEDNSFVEESLYTSPSRIVPPPSRVMSHRNTDDEEVIQAVAANLGVCLEDEDDEIFSNESENAGDSSLDEGGTSMESQPSSSVVSSVAEESGKYGESTTGSSNESTEERQSESSSEDLSEEADGENEKYMNLLGGPENQILSSTSSSRSSRSTAVADNRAPAALDRTLQKNNVAYDGEKINDARSREGVPPRSPARVENENLSQSDPIDFSMTTPTRGGRERSSSSVDGTSPSSMIQSKPPRPTTPQPLAATSPQKKTQGPPSPFHAKLVAMSPESQQDHSPWKEEDESNARLQTSSSSDNSRSEGLSFNSSNSSKPHRGRKSGDFLNSGGSVSSATSDASSDGGSNPWLYDAVESTLGPRSLSADLESLGGRSGKSQRSRRSSKSQPSSRRNRRTKRDRSSGSSRRSHSSPGNSNERRSASEIANSSYASNLMRLENHLARLHYADGGGDVSSTTTSVANESVISKSSSTRASDKQRIIVVVPPGKLGVILANRRDGRGTVISDIRPTSVLHGRLVPGDKLVAVDGVDVTGMVVSQITSIMATKSTKERQLTIITSAKLRKNAGTPQTQPVSTSESDISCE